MPTLEQLVTEITEGPLALSLAGPWADVFEADPARPQLDNRIGVLKPDAAHAIHAALTAPTRARVDPHVYRGTFLASISPLAFSLIGKDADLQAAWARLLNLATGGDEQINVANPAVVALLDTAVSQGLMTPEQRDGVTPTATPCSRSDELGWSAWSYTLVIEAKASVS